MNLPNKLTIFRIILVPAMMVFILIPITGDTISRILAAAFFLLAALTDFFDGMIARKYNLITNFGKFLDPLADKLLVVGALIAMAGAYDDISSLMAWAATLVFFREMAVTSLRLLVSTGDKIVVPANLLGKIKTTTQCVCIMTAILEPVILTPTIGTPSSLFTYITTAAMLIMTVWSAVSYFKAYAKYINPRA